MLTEDREPVWKAVADPARRRLLELLLTGPRTTGELCRAFATSRYAVMKHLEVLAAAGLVEVRRQGRERWNHLRAEPLAAIHREWWQRVLAAAGGAGRPRPGARTAPPRPPGELDMEED